MCDISSPQTETEGEKKRDPILSKCFNFFPDSNPSLSPQQGGVTFFRLSLMLNKAIR